MRVGSLTIRSAGLPADEQPTLNSAELDRIAFTMTPQGNVVQQLVDMIETQRAYEVSSKSITAVDEMMRYISNNL